MYETRQILEVMAKDPKGLRVIPTFRCKKGCKFCYQRTTEGNILNLDTLKTILDDLKLAKFRPMYVTMQGGEVMEVPNIEDYVDAVDKVFPEARKTVTTNGMHGIERYRALNRVGVHSFSFSLHKTQRRMEQWEWLVTDKILDLASNPFFTVRVNCFLDEANFENWRGVYEFCKGKNIPLTLCTDMRKEIANEDRMDLLQWINTSLGIEAEVRTYNYYAVIMPKGSDYRFWVFFHSHSYEHDNIIVLPNGKVTTDYQSVVDCEGAD